MTAVLDLMVAVSVHVLGLRAESAWRGVVGSLQ